LEDLRRNTRYTVGVPHRVIWFSRPQHHPPLSLNFRIGGLHVGR
jgi:hypothetical protein